MPPESNPTNPTPCPASLKNRTIEFMQNALTKVEPNKQQQKPSALAVMAQRIHVEPAKLMATLKSTVFAKASDEEMLALVAVANEYDLNPFLKEIYAFPAKGGGIVPIVSVDGWNKMLIRQPDFDGIEFEYHEDGEGKLTACTATVYIKSRSKPVKLTEYFDECKRNTDPWNTMPRRMLRNRTLCQAARLAFGFSGVHNDDEAASFIDVQATPMQEPPRLVAAPPAEAKPTPQQELAAFVLAEGHTFDTYRAWAAGAGQIGDVDVLASFDDVPEEMAIRHLRAKKGLISGLNATAPKA